MLAAAAATGQAQDVQQLCAMIAFESFGRIDKAICLWSAAAGFPVANPNHLDQHCRMLFSPDCKAQIQFLPDVPGAAERQAAVIESLRHLHGTFAMGIYEGRSLAEALCWLTAARGSLLLLKCTLALPHLPQAGLPYIRLQQGIAQAAAKHGRLAILQWMRQQLPRMPFNAATFQLAAVHDSPAVLLWLLRNDRQLFQIIVPEGCPANRLLCLAHAGWTVPWRQKPALWDLQRKHCAFYGAARWFARTSPTSASLGSLPDDVLARMAILAGIHWELADPYDSGKCSELPSD